MNTKKLALTAVLISLAMVLSYVEKLIPVFAAIPGVKIGLANIVVIFALYKLGIKEAFTISLFRVLLSSLLFGSVLSLAYSLSGAIVSLVAMALLMKTKIFTPAAISVVGGVLHNMAQLLIASFIIGSDILKYYSPILIISGICAGIIIGLVSATLIKRIDIE